MANNDTMIAAVVAFCDGNRGIGKNGGLPWPELKEDYDFYTGLCKTTKDPKKKNGVILGKICWEGWQEQWKTHPNISAVITSTTLTKDKEPRVRGIAKSYDEAINMFLNGPDKDEIENIYVLGGRRNYELCIQDPRCRRLIITRVYKDFDVDVTFPEFEQAYHKISHPEIADNLREDPTNGIKFRFEVWEKN